MEEGEQVSDTNPNILNGLAAENHPSSSANSLASPPSAACRAWNIPTFRRQLFDYLTPKECKNVLTLSKASFLDVVQSRYRVLSEDNLACLQRDVVCPKRYALYLKAVRIFEMDDLANAAHQFHIFPALDKISFGLRENRKFAISNLRIDADGGHRVDLLDYHELAFDTTQDEFFVVPNDGLPSTWSCGGVSKDRCNITILPARRPVARTPHTGNESTQAEYNVYTPLEKRLYPYDGLIAKLSIIPTVEIKKLVQVLLSKPNTWSKDEDPSVPTELSVIYEHCSGRALTRFAPLVQRGLKHLKLEREEVHATYVSLEAVLEHTCWDKLRGLRTLDLSVSDPKIHSKGRSYGTTAPVLEIAPVTCPPLHLDEFAIRFHIEGNTDVRGKRTDRLDLSCFPRLSNLALALLSIGGPACKYTLAITGPVNLKTAAHHVTSWLTALLRLEIAALLEVKPENAGWRRIKKEKDV